MTELTDEDLKAGWSHVGMYMQSFSFMESALDQCVGSVLAIGSSSNLIVCRNLAFGDKVAILRAQVALIPLSRDEAKRHDDMLKGLIAIAEERNMVAHSMFFCKLDGVKFAVVKAKSRLKIPDIFWSFKDFHDRVDMQVERQNEIEELDKLLRRANNLADQYFASNDALAQRVLGLSKQTGGDSGFDLTATTK